MTRKTINRRSFLDAAAGLIGGRGLSARAAFPAAETAVPLGGQPAGLPARQFA